MTRSGSCSGLARSAAVWFLGLLAVYLIIGVFLLDVPFVRDRLVDPWTRFNAAASAELASLIGVETTATGTRVRSGPARLNILEGCNGAHALVILLATTLAYPAPWARRLVGALTGTLVLLGFNLVRLVNLIVVARYFPARLELFHVHIWQTLIVLIALAFFVVWGSFFAERRTGVRAARSA